ncbi:uncharacterized protein LOC143558402 [Bidens hawaiensis]|uniref:uncharacterized protein LOC143558402 n=1 Tax=Bidens hawaiensis TaxID=980011 RepID=UPI00404A698C
MDGPVLLDLNELPVKEDVIEEQSENKKKSFKEPFVSQCFLSEEEAIVAVSAVSLMMAKKKDASTGSADASVLRRSGRETSSRKAERLEKHASPNPLPVKNTPEKVEKPMGAGPLRRSDRGKKVVETIELPNTKSTTKEKTSNNVKKSSEEVNEDTETEKQDADADVGSRKRKKWDAISYKAMFKSQKTKVETDVDKEPKSQSSIRVQGTPDKALFGGRVIDLDEIEHDDRPQTKSLDGKSIESGDVEKNNGVYVSPSNGNIANSDNHMCQTSPHRIAHDLENQQELDTCRKENAENNDVSRSTHNSKFVEFWVPVHISNVQLEQYCATLLTNDTLRSISKNDKLGALDIALKTNRAICNHPYTVNRNLEDSLAKDKSMIVKVGKEISGKFWLLDHILPEIQKHQLRVLILFQPPIAGLDVPLGHILVEFIHQRFGDDSYVHVDGVPNTPSKKQAANNLNKDKTRFIFLIDSRSCHHSIKLSSVDAIIIFDSELNPSVDLKSLQKLTIDTPLDQIMIFRLYCSSTLEEKILKLAENNVAVDFRSPSLRSNYDPLLMWGASDLFDRLTKFHRQTGLNISSEDAFLKDVVNEFLYILSHKCKSNDTSLKLISTRILNCGIYGKSASLHSEVKTHLHDGDPPYVFWKKLLDGRSPVWKFVSESNPRQRKRPRLILDSPPVADVGGVKTRRKTLNINPTVEPAQLKTGGVNDGIATENDESQSSSADTYWSKVSDETNVLDQLKLTASELCNTLKFSEDVKSTVVNFLEFVYYNFRLSKEHTTNTSLLHGFMLSLCWICSSIGESKTDRSESLALAKKHLNFICEEAEAEKVYEKLKLPKQRFLERTKSLPGLKDPVPAPEGVKVGTENSQHVTNVDPANEIVEAFERTNREWDEKRASIETDYKVDKSIIIALYNSNLLMRSGKLIIKEREFANKLEEHERMKEIRHKELNDISLQRSHDETGNTEVPPTVEVESDGEPVCEGVNFTESTGSHAAISSEQIGEVQAQQVGDEMEIDVVQKVDFGLGSSKGGFSSPDASSAGEDYSETGANDVAPRANCGDLETSVGNYNKESDVDGTAGLDENGRNETDKNDMAPHVDTGVVEMPAGNYNKENDEDDHIETGVNDMAPHVSSGGMEMPAGNYNKETDEDDHKETGANDMAPHVSSGDVEMPAGNDHKENDKGHDENDPNETGENDMVPHVSGDVELPVGTFNKENDEDDTVGIDAFHAAKDRHETVDDVPPEVESAEMETPAVHDVAPEVEYSEMETPAGACDNEDAEEGEILPDTPDVGDNINESSPRDVLPCVKPAEMATPADNEDYSASCGSSSNNHVFSPASEHEIQNDPLQVEQIPDTGVQDEEINIANQHDQIIPEVEPDMLSPISVVQDKEVNTINLQPSSADKVDQIILDNELDVTVAENPSDTVQHDQIISDVEPDMQLSGAGQVDQTIMDDEPDLTVAENPSDTAQHTGPLLEPVCEEPNLTVTQSGENMEENLVSVSATETEQQPSLVATSVAPTLLANTFNMFDNLANRLNPQITNQTDPLQAEVDRLYFIRETISKSYQEVEQKLNSECEKEIAEVVAQIRLKYEAKQQRTDSDYKLKNMELETNIKRVNMNKILAEAFKSKCQDLTPGHPGIQASQAETLLRRFSGTSSMMHYQGASSSSAGQSLGNHQSPSPPLPLQQSQPLPQQAQPLLQQPQPLPEQPQPQPPLQQLQSRSQLPLQIVQQPSALFYSTVSRPASTTPSRPPSPVVNQLTSSRLQPIRLPSIVSQATNSTTTTTTRMPTPTRPPPGLNMNGPSSFHNRPLGSTVMDMSAANLRINTETRGQSPHVRFLVSNETRAPTVTPHTRPLVLETRAPGLHIRPPVISKFRAPAPHLRPVEARAPAPHLRSRASTEIRARAPHMQPFRPTHSVSPDAESHRRVSPTQNVTGGPPPPPPQPSLLPSENGAVQIADLIGEGITAHTLSAAPDLVCLSDDD